MVIICMRSIARKYQLKTKLREISWLMKYNNQLLQLKVFARNEKYFTKK